MQSISRNSVPDHRPDLDERGATLLEAALAVTILGSMLVVASHVVSIEMERQRAYHLGRDLRNMTLLAREFVRDEYGRLLSDLASLSSDSALLELDLEELAHTGHVPNSFLNGGEHENDLGQTYRVFVRAVSSLDAGHPPATLLVAELDGDNDGQIDPHLVDGNPANDEAELESLLITTGGEPVPRLLGNAAVAASGLAVTGYMADVGVARGVHGNWSLDISEFDELSEYPDQQGFVSLLSLAGFGVLDFDGILGHPFGAGNGEESYPFERCPDLDGDLLTQCAADNRVYTDIQLNAVDEDGDGTIDRLGTVADVHAIQMNPRLDTDSDGDVDSLSSISGLVRLACEAGANGTVSQGTLLVQCNDVEFSGDLSIGSDLSVGGSVAGTRFLASAVGGQDLTRGIYAAHVLPMDSDTKVDKPTCNDSGSAPSVFVAPVSFASPGGTPIVGLQAFAESADGGRKWQVGMRLAVDRDSDGDGNADVVRLQSANDHVLVLTKCS